MDPQHLNIGYLLNKASRMTKWELNNKLKEYNLTSSQFAVLKDVHTQQQNLEACTPAAIAERLHADRPTISGVIERLKRADWLDSIVNPQDRRSQLIRVTEKTSQLMAELELLGNDTMKKAVLDFSKEEIEQFKDYLHRITTNLSQP